MGLTNSPTLSTRRRSNKTKKTRTVNTDIIPEYFTKILEEFNNLTYIGYNNRQGKDNHTEAYFLLIKQIYQILKNNSHIPSNKKGMQFDGVNKNH